MIPSRRIFLNSSLLKALQVGAFVLSVVAVGVYLRHSLDADADTFQKDFERQSFMELTKGETFIIARKLAALAKGPQFQCVSAKKAGTIFFAEENGPCGPGIYRSVRSVVEPNQEIEVNFTLRLRSDLSTGFLLFVIMQVVVGISVVLVQRQAWLAANRKDLELADLARQVGHDIRSPLASLQVGLRGHGDSASVVALARLRELVDHLLGRQLPGAVAQVGSLLEAVRAEKSVELGDGIEISVLADGTVGRQILPGGAFFWHRILSNLINNSFEAKSAGLVRVQLAAGLKDQSVVIEVVDNGAGIEADLLRRLARESVTEGKAGGSGIGVSSARGFVESLGGACTIASEVGRGTRVTLSVPRQQVAVLIEDDLALAKLWFMASESVGVSLRHFPSWEAFLASSDAISRSASVYLDTEFSGASLKVDAAVEALAARGFRDIYLCTGHPAEKFRGLAGIRGIVPKEPPWL